MADREQTLLLSGTGDVVEPDDGVIAIGSGGNYALSAARALMRHTDMELTEVVRAAMVIAAEICVFTNENLIIETI